MLPSPFPCMDLSKGPLRGHIKGCHKLSPPFVFRGVKTEKSDMLKKIQAVTGLVFAGFLALHLTNTWLAALGSGAYDGVQAWLRVLYQFAPVEALLLAALMVHIATGVMRIVQEPKRNLTLRARLHRYAGFFLVAVIGGHILAVRGASWFYDVYPGFQGLAFSVDAAPGFFYPYYFLLALAGLYHGMNGVGIAAGRLRLHPGISTQALRRATLAGGALTVAALLGLGGWLFEVGAVYESEFSKLVQELTGVTFTP
jgi:succinate dehydrogenase/fumarate reductase cytochrome b subunit